MPEIPDVTMDFEAWKRLAASDPAAFESLRRRCIDATIARAPAERRERLRRLQWRIDQTRRQAGSPLAACIAVSNMMWESLAGRGGLLNALRMAATPPRRAAKVLSFEPRRPH